MEPESVGGSCMADTRGSTAFLIYIWRSKPGDHSGIQERGEDGGRRCPHRQNLRFPRELCTGRHTRPVKHRQPANRIAGVERSDCARWRLRKCSHGIPGRPHPCPPATTGACGDGCNKHINDIVHGKLGQCQRSDRIPSRCCGGYKLRIDPDEIQ